MENKSRQKLEVRLRKFSLDIVSLFKSLPKTEENRIYGRQIIRSASSIGANYAEALCAHTRLDFIHDLNKSRKEARETLYWLELISDVNPTFTKQLKDITDESSQLFKIFMSSVKTAKYNNLKDGIQNKKTLK